MVRDGEDRQHHRPRTRPYGDPLMEAGFVAAELPASATRPRFLRGYGRAPTPSRARRAVACTACTWSLIMAIETVLPRAHRHRPSTTGPASGSIEVMALLGGLVEPTAPAAPSSEPQSIDQTAAWASSPFGRLLWHTCSQTTLSVGVYGIYALTNAWFVARGVGATGWPRSTSPPRDPARWAPCRPRSASGAPRWCPAPWAPATPPGRAGGGDGLRRVLAAAVAVTVAGCCWHRAAADPARRRRGRPATTPATYAVIILAGAIFSTGFSSLVRAEGRMRFSTMLWVVPVLVQITLDPLLIFGFGLGVRGAALGTVGGQAVSAVMAVWFFFGQRRRPYRIRPADLRPHGPTLRALIGIGNCGEGAAAGCAMAPGMGLRQRQREPRDLPRVRPGVRGISVGTAKGGVRWTSNLQARLP